MDIEEIHNLFDRQQRRDVEFPDMRRDVLPNVVRFVRPARATARRDSAM